MGLNRSNNFLVTLSKCINFNIDIWQLKMSMLYHFLFFLNWWISKNISLNRYLFGATIKIVYKKRILKEFMRTYFWYESIFCLGIYMSVSKPSICFCNKLLIHNINLADHRKMHVVYGSWFFLEIWVIAQLWHWRSQGLPKGCCHHDLNVLLNTIKNMK